MDNLPQYPYAIAHPTPSFGFPQGTHGRRGQPIKFIVVHGTGWPYTFAQYLAEPPALIACHFMVGKGGEVMQSIDIADASWANGKLEPGHDPLWESFTTDDPQSQTVPGERWVNPNLLSISIEHENWSKTNSDLLTLPQFFSSVMLIRFLCGYCGIPTHHATDSKGGITGHNSMEPVTRDFCPGAYPFVDLYAMLSEYGS